MIKTNSKSIIHTKFGNAQMDQGYYRIFSSKEGNRGKMLHRVIFEDFYGEIPKGHIVHHKDGNKTNNCILNLQLMRWGTHTSLHNIGNTNMLGKKHSKESIKKMSESKKGENHYNYGKHLSKEHKKKLSKAFSGENNPMYGKQHSEETKQKMSNAKKGENHPMYGKQHLEETKRKISEAKNTSGYYRVYKINDKNCKQGFRWKYQYYNENGKKKSISSVSIEKLEEKVLEKGLEWFVVDEEKAKGGKIL